MPASDAPILNQPWEDVSADVCGAIQAAVQPLLKKAVDDIYGGLLDATQDYLTDNLAFNIASRINVAEREARRDRERCNILTAALRRIAVASNAGHIDGLTEEAVNAIAGADEALLLAEGRPA